MRFVLIGILIGVVILFSIPRSIPEWQRQTIIFGSYKLADVVSPITLNFSREENSFWVLGVDDDTLDQKKIYSGRYTSLGDNLFAFKGLKIGELESFSIINRHLDIKVVTSEEVYIFRRVDDATFGVTNEFD